MSDNNRGFLKGTIIGAVVGTIAALLLAPKSGKETQADIKQAAAGAKEDLNNRVNEVREDLSGKVEELKVAAQDLRGEAKVESQELIARAELIKDQLRESGGRLGKTTSKVGEEVSRDARLLVDQGAGLMVELERVAKKLGTSVKSKVVKAPAKKPVRKSPGK